MRLFTLLLLINSSDREELTNDADEGINGVDQMGCLCGIFRDHFHVQKNRQRTRADHEIRVLLEGKQRQNRGEKADQGMTVIQEHVAGAQSLHDRVERDKRDHKDDRHEEPGAWLQLFKFG